MVAFFSMLAVAVLPRGCSGLGMDLVNATVEKGRRITCKNLNYAPLSQL